MPKTKRATRTIVTSRQPNPFASPYGTRLARQVAQELTSSRQASMQRKKKTRSTGK
jgi:hypothetical protein